MKKLRKAVLIGLGLLPFFMPVDAAPIDDMSDTSDALSSSTSTLRKARFSLEMQGGSRSIGSIDILAPFMGDDDFMVYGNLKAKIGTNSSGSSAGTAFEGNLGVGVRRVNDADTAILGAYAYYDHLKSVNDNTFQQITVGAERLGLTWDFRANAYLPIGTTTYQQNIYDQTVIDQHNLIEYYRSDTETAVAGADVEIGRTLGSNRLRGYAAVYTFGNDLTGTRVRLDYKLNHHFSLNAATQYDQARGFQYLLGVRYSLGGAEAKVSNSIHNRLTDEVVRDVDIVTTNQQVAQVKTDVDKFWVVDTNSDTPGNGTLENPFNQLEQAVAAAPENAIIVIKGGATSGTTATNIVNMKNGQTIWGGQNSLYWDFDTNSASFAAGKNTLLLQSAEGVKQTIAGAVTTANNTSIYGINIVADNKNPQQNGILINNNQHVIIQDVTISGFASHDGKDNFHGISIQGDSSVNLSGINLKDNDYGLYANGGNITSDQLSITNSNATGMQLTNAHFTADSVNITNSGQHGVMLQNSSMTVDNFTVSHSQYHGGYFTNSQVKLGATNLSYNQQHGLSALNSTIEFKSLLSHDNAWSGLDFTNSNIMVAENLVSNNNLLQGINSINTDITAQSLALFNNLNGMIYNGGNLHIETASVTNNAQHGLNLLSGTVSFNTLELTSNGNAAAAKNSAGSIRDLNSALRLGSDNASTNFSVNHLTVTNNEAGIELIAGQINIDQDGNNVKYHSVIDGNLGYGLFIHAENAAAVALNRTVNIQNADITNTQQLANKDSEYTTSGHGILADRSNSVVLNNVNINNNLGNGIWLKRGNFVGSNINLLANGTQSPENINTNNNINLFNYGLRIEQVDSSAASKVMLENININDTKGHGVLVTGGDVTLTHLEIKNNQDGILYMNGKLSLYDALLENNNRFGLHIKYDGSYASQQTDGQVKLYDSFIKGTKNSYEDAFNRGTGHGIYIEGMRSQLSNAITLNNIELDHNDGLGIYIENDVKLYLNDSKITFNGEHNNRLGNIGGENSDGLKAGGIYAEYKASQGSKININSSVISHNYGGGVIVWGVKQGSSNKSDYGAHHTLNITNSTIEANQGVGVRMDKGTVKGSTLKENAVKNQFWELDHKNRPCYFNGGIGNVEINPSVHLENDHIDNYDNLERRL